MIDANSSSSGSISGCADSKSGEYWWVGAIIYIFGSITINLGNNLIRLSHDRNDRLPIEQQRGILKRPIWWAGLLSLSLASVTSTSASSITVSCSVSLVVHYSLNISSHSPGIMTFVCGNVCNFVGFMFAAQALLSSLGSVQFLSNLFFAAMVNKEKVWWLDNVAIVAAMALPP